ncbi:hypothetical protein Gohar_006407 [Gossypium harknessii]|uniref:Uncharacterized protein n=1 Tax=Gossypium harknessii TaxID=34285 RepID=A0A7J9GDB3_9ROSI|nr:hypothetical protein [Gossypium harknessii]
MAAIVSILVAGAIGVCFPLLGKTIDALRPEKDIFFVIKAFAAGVILSTGFIHVLPDATENLTSPCLNQNPWGKFPFAGLFNFGFNSASPIPSSITGFGIGNSGALCDNRDIFGCF